MFEVGVVGLKYIQDVPVELTKKAINEGLLTSGCIVGLMVYPVGDENNHFILDVELTDPGQSILLNSGCIIPLQDSHGVHKVDSNWTNYLKRCVNIGSNERKTEKLGNTRPRPSF